MGETDANRSQQPKKQSTDSLNVCQQSLQGPKSQNDSEATRPTSGILRLVVVVQ